MGKKRKKPEDEKGKKTLLEETKNAIERLGRIRPLLSGDEIEEILKEENTNFLIDIFERSQDKEFRQVCLLAFGRRVKEDKEARKAVFKTFTEEKDTTIRNMCINIIWGNKEVFHPMIRAYTKIP